MYRGPLVSQPGGIQGMIYFCKHLLFKIRLSVKLEPRLIKAQNFR